MRTCLLFTRGGIRFALELGHVRRICAIGEVRTLPAPSEGVLGVVPDGSHVVPVIEAPLPSPQPNPNPPRILLLNNGESPFGFRVELLEGPRRLRFDWAFSVAELRGIQPLLREVPEDAIRGVYWHGQGMGHGQGIGQGIGQGYGQGLGQGVGQGPGHPLFSAGTPGGPTATPTTMASALLEPVVLVVPSALYRARLLPEDA